MFKYSFYYFFSMIPLGSEADNFGQVQPMFDYNGSFSGFGLGSLTIWDSGSVCVVQQRLDQDNKIPEAHLNQDLKAGAQYRRPRTVAYMRLGSVFDQHILLDSESWW